jgi:large subunit ribosomal protein L10
LASEEKIAKVEEIKSILENVGGIIFTDHTGLDAENLYSIRNKLYEINARIRIIKNSLTLLAANKVYESIDFTEVLTGPTSIVSGDDIIVAARLVKGFAREFETFRIKAGIIDGKLYDSKSINRIASLPAKEVLVAQFLGLLNIQVVSLVTILNNIPGSLVGVLDMVRKQKEQQSA